MFRISVNYPVFPMDFRMGFGMMMFSFIVFTFMLLLSTTHSVQASQSQSIDNRINQTFIGDLAEIRKRRILRVLVSYNRTNFFHTDKGARGLEHDLMIEYERYLNRGPRKERYKTHIVFLTKPFNQLLDALVNGEGDIIASGFSITPERKALVDFTDPYINNVNEILVSHKNAPTIERLQDLAGKKMVVVANSSYVINLQRINLALGGLGLEPLEIIQADDLLEAEDILEMVNAGLFDFTVVDNHIAKIYQKVFDNLYLHENFILNNGGKIAWAINKKLPKLKDSLNHFIENYARPGRFLGNSVYRKYFENPFWIQHPLDFTALDKTPCLHYYFEKYAEFYDFDWFLIAAQAYKESKFNQKLVSNRGAYGVMQIKPSTAKSKHVQIKNIKTNMENNIHAGVRYLAFLRDHYFDKPQYSEEDKINFALAAYNAGPGRVRQLQRIAERKGLAPNKWFYNVEVIARNQIGHETVNYVTVIQKTMEALKLATKLAEEKRLLKEKQFDELSRDLMDEDSILEGNTQESEQSQSNKNTSKILRGFEALDANKNTQPSTAPESLGEGEDDAEPGAEPTLLKKTITPKMPNSL